MQFSSAPYTFHIDDEAYTLPKYTMDDYEAVQKALEGLEDQHKPKALHEYVLKRAADKRTKDGIRRLALRDFTALFRDWSNLTSGDVEPGESSGSTD